MRDWTDEQFLSVANRTVLATDVCLNSLRLGHSFNVRNDLDRAQFLQMNLFKPAFKPDKFDLVVCNGVLHHTSDPFLGFRTIGELVRPGGYILVGLYHRFGRLITDTRRLIFRVARDRFTFLDPNLRRRAKEDDPKRRAWLMDQYKHRHESKHTIGEVLEWLRETGFQFVSSIPDSVPFQRMASDERLFEPRRPGNRLERMIVELGMIPRGRK